MGKLFQLLRVSFKHVLWGELAGRQRLVLTLFCISGQVRDQCHPSNPDNKDSLQTRAATKEEPVNSAYAHGECHKMHDVLQGSLLEEEG